MSTKRLTIAAVFLASVSIGFAFVHVAGTDQALAANSASQGNDEPVVFMRRIEVESEWEASVFAALSSPLQSADGAARQVRCLSYGIEFRSAERPGGPRIMNCQALGVGDATAQSANISVGPGRGTSGEGATILTFEVELRPAAGKTWGKVHDQEDVQVICRVLEAR